MVGILKIFFKSEYQIFINSILLKRNYRLLIYQFLFHGKALSISVTFEVLSWILGKVKQIQIYLQHLTKI